MLMLEVGKNCLILEIRFCGTDKKSPGLRWMSSDKFRDTSIAFTFNRRDSTRSSEPRRNRLIWECLARAVRPPAMATASVTRRSDRNSYLAGRLTSPPTIKYGSAQFLTHA